MKRYTLENKPNFKDGEIVAVDSSFLGLELGIIPGRIVGKGMTHVIDFWLIEFNMDFSPLYPYKVVSVIHTAILEK